jgi:hypothetical protein
MTTSTYVRVAGGVVAEPPLEIASTVNIAALFQGATFVNVTAYGTTPQEGWTATETGGVWSFAAPAAPAAVVPNFVSRASLMAVFSATSGTGGGSLYANVNAWVATQSEALQIIWSHKDILYRNGTFMTAAIANFGWSSGEADGFFTAAAAAAGMG